MREIKFRAWDSRTKEWLFGYDYPNLGGFSMKGEIICLGEYSTFFQSIPIPDWHKIILTQFTGLHDKNGNEIYEGDWCRAEFRTKDGIQAIQGKIIMDEYMWCIDCTESIGDDIFSINRPHNFEVIGNIYETPELL